MPSVDPARIYPPPPTTMGGEPAATSAERGPTEPPPRGGSSTSGGMYGYGGPPPGYGPPPPYHHPRMPGAATGGPNGPPQQGGYIPPPHHAMQYPAGYSMPPPPHYPPYGQQRPPPWATPAAGTAGGSSAPPPDDPYGGGGGYPMQMARPRGSSSGARCAGTARDSSSRFQKGGPETNSPIPPTTNRITSSMEKQTDSIANPVSTEEEERKLSPSSSTGNKPSYSVETTTAAAPPALEGMDMERVKAHAAEEVTVTEVKPMNTDFHFFVRDMRDQLLEVAAQEVDKSLKDKEEEFVREHRQYLINSNLNCRLMKAWEDLPTERREDYLKKEEDDRNRFMEEDAIATRHCFTLTARLRSPSKKSPLMAAMEEQHEREKEAAAVAAAAAATATAASASSYSTARHATTAPTTTVAQALPASVTETRERPDTNDADGNGMETGAVKDVKPSLSPVKQEETDKPAGGDMSPPAADGLSEDKDEGKRSPDVLPAGDESPTKKTRPEEDTKDGES